MAETIYGKGSSPGKHKDQNENGEGHEAKRSSAEAEWHGVAERSCPPIQGCSQEALPEEHIGESCLHRGLTCYACIWHSPLRHSMCGLLYNLCVTVIPHHAVKLSAGCFASERGSDASGRGSNAGTSNTSLPISSTAVQVHTCSEGVLVFVVRDCYDALAKGGDVSSALIVRATQKVFPTAPHPLLPVYAALQLSQVWCHIYTDILPTKACLIRAQCSQASDTGNLPCQQRDIRQL